MCFYSIAFAECKTLYLRSPYHVTILDMILKSKFLRLILLQDEIQYFHESLSAENTFLQRFRLTKQNFLILNVFKESLPDFNEILKDYPDLVQKTKSIRKRLEFINHIRNKVSGHLDGDLLLRAVQWEPLIFSQEGKGKREFQVTFAYKAVLESAINSYIDPSDKEVQKEFGTEIDLAYPPDVGRFFNYLGNLNIDCIKWLDEMLTIIEKSVKYSNGKEMFDSAKKAGLTDFNLKKKFEVANIYSDKPDELMLAMEDAYNEKNKDLKVKKLELIIKKLEEEKNKRKGKLQ